MVSEFTNKLHIAILPSTGMGHVTPLFELAKSLVINHNVHVSFLIIPSQSALAQNELLSSKNVPSDLDVVVLPAVDISQAITEDMRVVTRMCVMIREHLKSLPSVLKEINFPKALILDHFTTDAFEPCEELSIPVYCFFPASANCLTFSLYLPIMDKEVEGEYVDLPEPVQVPGCKAICIEDLVPSVQERKKDAYKWFLFHMSRLVRARGIIENTWEELEPVPLKAIREHPFYKEIQTRPLFPVGPLIKQVEQAKEPDNLIISWLDKQPADSVLFITLGSGGTLSRPQLAELTQGLELSQQRFILVARKPAGENITSYFNAGKIDDNNPESYLPSGFMDRTQGVGLVIPEWSPQVSVLAHSATGGFLSHCGWNSTLESLANGVPMIAWPLYAEQRMNATSLVEEIQVAVKPRRDTETGLVMKEEIERVVRLVLQGEEGKIMRNKAKELQESSKKDLSPGGSSYESLSSLVKEIKG